MNIEESIRRMEEIFERVKQKRREKGHDYSGDEDSLSNLRDFGWQGVWVRIGDKYHRGKNFIKSGRLKVEDEKMDDTILDTIVYGFIAAMMYEEEKNQNGKH